MAMALDNQHKLESALEMYENAVIVYKKAYGEEHCFSRDGAWMMRFYSTGVIICNLFLLLLVKPRIFHHHFLGLHYLSSIILGDDVIWF